MGGQQGIAPIYKEKTGYWAAKIVQFQEYSNETHTVFFHSTTSFEDEKKNS